MLVSVVIPAFNQADYLRQAVAAALAQTHTEVEVLVIDDGSTDHTAQVVQEFRDPRIRYLYQENDGTHGLGARNRGLLEARGSWIALLDQDDLWSPHKLEKQLERARRAVDVHCVFCLARFIDERGQVTGQQQDAPEGDVYCEILARNRYYASTGMFRRELLAKAGLPHESSGYADWQLWLSLARHSRVAVVPEHLADYRVQPASFQQLQRAQRSFSFAVDNWRTLLAQRCRIPAGDRLCWRAYRRGMKVNSALFTRAARDASSIGRIGAALLAWRHAISCAPVHRLLPWTAAHDFTALLLSWAMSRPIGARSRSRLRGVR